MSFLQTGVRHPEDEGRGGEVSRVRRRASSRPGGPGGGPGAGSACDDSLRGYNPFEPDPYVEPFPDVEVPSGESWKVPTPEMGMFFAGPIDHEKHFLSKTEREQLAAQRRADRKKWRERGFSIGFASYP